MNIQDICNKTLAMHFEKHVSWHFSSESARSMVRVWPTNVFVSHWMQKKTSNFWISLTLAIGSWLAQSACDCTKTELRLDPRLANMWCEAIGWYLGSRIKYSSPLCVSKISKCLWSELMQDETSEWMLVGESTGVIYCCDSEVRSKRVSFCIKIRLSVRVKSVLRNPILIAVNHGFICKRHLVCLDIPWLTSACITVLGQFSAQFDWVEKFLAPSTRRIPFIMQLSCRVTGYRVGHHANTTYFIASNGCITNAVITWGNAADTYNMNHIKCTSDRNLSPFENLWLRPWSQP